MNGDSPQPLRPARLRLFARRHRYRRTVPLYLGLDVWQSLGYGSDVREYEAFVERHGWGGAWALLCAWVRDPRAYADQQPTARQSDSTDHSPPSGS